MKSISYNEENGYYVDAVDVRELIQKYIENEEYDHIFVAVKLGDILHTDEVGDWIGLGGMDYYGIGFSNIRLPNEEKSYIYKYDSERNIFPEEVFVHEFIHTLERNLKEYGYEIPALHDNKIYGYEDERLIGLKKWYKDYMQCLIKTKDNKKIGLDKIVYTIKPVQKSDFEYSYNLTSKLLKEPQNIVEEFKIILKKIVQYLKND